MKMVSKNAKQIVYRYNGVESSEEYEVDLGGDIHIPPNGGLICRKDKYWKVISTQIQESNDGSIPIVKVFLVDQIA
jgi:hypothetical protein